MEPAPTPEAAPAAKPGFLASTWKFLHTGPGMLVLGALVTTGGGTWLNYTVQGRSQDKQRQFEIFKIMLEESRDLQGQLLTLANRRFYALKAMRARIESDEYAMPEVQDYFDTKVRPLREEWNEQLLLVYSKLKILFPDEAEGPLAGIRLAGLFYAEDEDPAKAPGLDEAVPDLPAERMPRTVHGSFTVAQRLLWAWLKDCKEKGREACVSEKRSKAVRAYIDHLGRKIATLSDGLTTRLLYMPYGTARTP